MDHQSEKDFDVDLESGESVSEEGSIETPVSSVKKQAKSLITNICSAFVDKLDKGEEGLSLCNIDNSNKISAVDVKVVTDKILEEGDNTFDSAAKTSVKEKRKKTSNKKAPKPPRPPRGPSLDAADQKLIKEISELAMLKRARIERMKALKKLKATKTSSSNSNMFSMVFTILFCLVILFQGMSSRSSPESFQGSPLSTGVVEGGFISVQQQPMPNSSATFSSGPGSGTGSGSPNLIEEVAGSDHEENPPRVAQ